MNWRMWVAAARPKTLSASVVPVISATALVYGIGYKIDWTISIYALAASLLIQIGTNLINDSMDFKKGADQEDRLGPKRVTQAGVFSEKSVLYAGIFCLALALIFGIPLVLKGGLPIITIGILSLLFGYAYTGGPFPLAYQGLGDLFVILFFGVVAVMGVAYLQIGQWLFSSLILGLQVGFLCTVLIAINNFRDLGGDRRAGKKTLAVRFGKRFIRIEIAGLLLMTFLLQLYWLFLGFALAFSLAFLIIPTAYRLAKEIFENEPSQIFNQYLARASLLHLAFGLLISIGFIL